MLRNMRGDKKVICTVGPASLNMSVLRRFEVQDVALVRINLSHVAIEDIESTIDVLRQCRIPIAIDTEGCQVRTGYLGKEGVYFHQNELVKIHNKKIIADSQNIYLTPEDVVSHCRPGDMIAIDFNSALLRVENVDSLRSEGFITCRVIIEGHVDSRKGVHYDGDGISMPTFSRKDVAAIELAKKHGIKHFTLSFIDDDLGVYEFKKMCPDAIAYAKVETREGVRNVASILRAADGILIDRGDLSREVPIEKIPLTQKYLIQEARKQNKEVFVASNLLETMATCMKPTRAEVNDVVNTVIDGVTGFVLTKETAVGRYPVETVNMMYNLMRQADKYQGVRKDTESNVVVIEGTQATHDIASDAINGCSDFLIAPHGGMLVDKRIRGCELSGYDLERLEKLSLSDDILMDLEQIGVGTFSPLQGFMGEDDYQSVLNEMRLANGEIWTIPIVLSATADEVKRFKGDKEIALTSKKDGDIYGVLELESIYRYSKSDYAEKIYGTTDSAHPGIQYLNNMGEYFLGGNIKLVRRMSTDYARIHITPRQAREIFSSMGWSRVVGFHTRNVIHRSHEHIQMEAMERCGCDGLFVHPVAGKKKKGDYTTEAIIQSYEMMIEKYYPKNKVIFGVFLTHPRYAGPREAVFTALCRKNYGCSHFIVGRDHTGVGKYYHPEASQNIFGQWDGLGIEPVFFGEIAYSKMMNMYADKAVCNAQDYISISGTEARSMLRNKTMPPEWFMRPAISELIINKIASGEEVFC